MRELTAEDFKKVKKNPFYDRLIKEVANMNGETPESVMKRCLSELCSMLLDEYGINVREKAKETAIEVNKVSISGEFMEKFSGMYYSRYRSFRVDLIDDLLKIQFREANGWGGIVTDAFFNGQHFISGNRKFGFEEYKDSLYLIEEEVPLDGRSPMGQKLTPLT